MSWGFYRVHHRSFEQWWKMAIRIAYGAGALYDYSWEFKLLWADVIRQAIEDHDYEWFDTLYCKGICEQLGLSHTYVRRKAHGVITPGERRRAHAAKVLAKRKKEQIQLNRYAAKEARGQCERARIASENSQRMKRWIAYRESPEGEYIDDAD
ncbi:MAG: hypothetical protein GY923_15415 [Aestuariibacter sp.]|nr:hypothetical protein [Aestuariibacter sp.]